MYVDFSFRRIFSFTFYVSSTHTQKDCVEWCDGVKESPEAEAYMTENPSGTSSVIIFLSSQNTRSKRTNQLHSLHTHTDGEHLLWRATCIESCTSVYKDEDGPEL